MANAEKLRVTSSAFKEGAMIPKEYSCDGHEQLFPIEWSQVPVTTQSIAVLIDDPDAPFGTYTHLVAWNIPPAVNQITSETREITFGLNSAGKPAYRGPCPPLGTHRYYTRIYALSIKDLDNEPHDKKWFLKAIKGHVVAQGELMGTYKRHK